MIRVQFSIGQGFTADGAPIADLSSRKSRAYTYIASVFGGFHTSLGDGGWMDDNRLVLEPDLTITTVIDAAKMPLVSNAATFLADCFSQASVLFTSEHVNAKFTER